MFETISWLILTLASSRFKIIYRVDSYNCLFETIYRVDSYRRLVEGSFLQLLVKRELMGGRFFHLHALDYYRAYSYICLFETIYRVDSYISWLEKINRVDFLPNYEQGQPLHSGFY